MTKLIIFDADGTLVTTKSGATFRKSAADWTWLPGRTEKLADLCRAGVKLACATNQGGVAFGYMEEADIWRELKKMAEEATFPSGAPMPIAVCFSHPKATIERYREDSPRRKPGPGMILEIIEKSSESKADTLFVGDRPEDEQAAVAAGVAFQWAEDFFA